MMKDSGFALRLIVSTSLGEVVEGILMLQSKRDSGRASMAETFQLLQWEDDLDYVMNNLEGDAVPDPRLVGRA